MWITLPDVATGACPPGAIPVYRLWNRRVDSNHRYVIDPSLRAEYLLLTAAEQGNLGKVADARATLAEFRKYPAADPSSTPLHKLHTHKFVASTTHGYATVRERTVNSARRETVVKRRGRRNLLADRPPLQKLEALRLAE